MGEQQEPQQLQALLRREAWRNPAVFDEWQREAYQLAAELRQSTGRKEVGSFGRWLKIASPGWPWHYAHLKAVRRALRRIERGESRRLMIFLHPRSFKSQMVTVRYPAYLLERDPMTRIMIASYNQTLAESFSHETRRIVTERQVALDPKRQMVDHWLTLAGGGLRAVGVGAGATGHGASVAIIDDPVKSAAEVRSAAYRERVWAWWQNDIVTRLEPHPRTGVAPAVILVMTRWGEDDLAGRILTGEGGHEWDVLRVPALAETQAERDDYNASIGRLAGEPDPLGREPGQAMNPERFDVAALAERQAEMGIVPFSALYQQRPTAAEGDMFRRDWFEVVERIPDGERALVRYWDKAGSTTKSSAWTAGVLMARVKTGGATAWYVVHVVMGKWEAAERERVILQTAASDFAAWGHDVEVMVEQEPGSGGKESAQNTIRNLAGYRVSADRPTGDKALRAEPLAAQASIGRVKLVAGEWNRDYLDILAAFPGGAIKDPVDASSGAFARLADVGEKVVATPPRVVGRDIFRE